MVLLFVVLFVCGVVTELCVANQQIVTLLPMAAIRRVLC
jgi:hypothetical protein